MGATPFHRRDCHPSQVSIHAPVWVRPIKDDWRLGSIIVSIHAPVWVRPTIERNKTMSNQFQFTHPCGCDLRGSTRFLQLQKFQFTHPCGCDAIYGGGNVVHAGFNSRTRVGATCIEMGLPRYDEVSIHAPVWVRRSSSTATI